MVSNLRKLSFVNFPKGIPQTYAQIFHTVLWKELSDLWLVSKYVTNIGYSWKSHQNSQTFSSLTSLRFKPLQGVFSKKNLKFNNSTNVLCKSRTQVLNYQRHSQSAFPHRPHVWCKVGRWANCANGLPHWHLCQYHMGNPSRICFVCGLST